jgi:putative peptide modification system cyclase
MCDLVDSTALVETLDDDTAAQLMQQHDRMTRSVMRRYEGLEVDRTDGFLLVFESPTAAVKFALDYQHELRILATESRRHLAARVGIHFGEVVAWENAPHDVERGARPSEIDGLAISVVARLVSLALPGQILVSEIAQHIARRVDRQSEEGRSYSWKSHGRYTFKGLADAIAVYEAGEEGVAPMRQPTASGKARPTTPSWRRPTALAGGGIALLVASGIALYFWTRHDLPLALGERDWVVLGEVVNVNSDPTLDAPLAAAFRIGLEESRFVNVVPAGAVRNALLRMQRNDVTRIDRDIASEIALREQARGVIVPSIAQYGTSLRVAVELIDPNSAQTVWTQSADAAGTNELLGATDRLLRSLRSRLGESLPLIEATSQPLEKAATPSIEALRAFSRATRLEGVGDTEQAKILLTYAIGIDPNFAAAYARLGAISFAEQRHAEARSALQKALAINDRLSERERVFVAGVLSYYLDPPAMLSAWGLFSNLYPQWSNGPHNIGNVNRPGF